MPIDKQVGIYITCNKHSRIPRSSFFIPVQARSGEVLTPYCLKKEKNNDCNFFNQKKLSFHLATLYWAWKNENKDYYGFFQEQRYLDLSVPELTNFQEERSISFEQLEKEIFQLEEKKVLEMMTKQDFIVSSPLDLKEQGFSNIREHYQFSDFHYVEYLDEAVKILKEKYPSYSNVADAYLGNSIFYPYNIFLTSKKELDAYCTWLFDILFALEAILDISHYSVEEAMVLENVAERLFGIYLYKNYPLKKIKKLPTLFIADMGKEKTLPDLSISDQIPVLMCSSSGLFPVLSVTLESIRQNLFKQKKVKVFVLVDEICEQKQEIIERQFNGSLLEVVFLDVKSLIKSLKIETNYHLSQQTFFRLLVGDFFPNLNKIIYLDTDTIVCSDIAELYQTDMQENVIAGVKDADHAGQIRLYKRKIEDFTREELGLENPFDYIQAGVLLMNPAKMKKTGKGVDLIKEANEKRYPYLDQDYLNYKFKGKIAFLSFKWNVLTDCGRTRIDLIKKAPRDICREYLASRETPSIVHFAGYEKPWSSVKMDFAELFWKYARSTPFYEELLVNNFKEKKVRSVFFDENAVINFKELVKRWFPPGTRGHKILSRIYRKLPISKR